MRWRTALIAWVWLLATVSGLAQYKPGDPVHVWQACNVRTAPKADPSTLIGQQTAGATGRLTTGVLTRDQDAASAEWWLQVTFDSGPSGWVGGSSIVLEQRGTKVALRWVDNSDNEEGFRVEKQEGPAAAFAPLDSVDRNVVRYMDAAVSAGNTYGYRVRAFNAGGDSAPSNVVLTEIFPPVAPPAAPNATSVELPERQGNVRNLSTRATVESGDGLMIAGLVVADAPVRVLVRAVGPTLGAAPYNVPGVLADPSIEIVNVAGATNDNWSGQDVADAAAAVGAFALPAGSKDAALLVTLDPGTYTILVRGADGGTGVALVEVYQVP